MERIISFDFFKIFAILFVIMVHTGTFMHNPYVGVVIDSLGRFAVPFFLMVTGYLFTSKYKNSGYFKKHTVRLLKIYVTGTLIYLAFNMGIDFINQKNVANEFIKRIDPIGVIYYGDSVAEHLWFLPAVIFSISLLYICLKFNALGKLLIVAFLLNLIGLFGEEQLYSQFFVIPLKTRDTLFFALFYTILGAYISKQETPRSSNKYLYLFLLFTILHITERIILTRISGISIGGDYNLLLIPMMYFLFKFALSSIKLYSPEIIQKLSSSVLWIYVSHMLFVILGFTILALLNMFKVIPTIWWNLIFTPIVFICSYLTHRLYIKIKK